MEIKRNKITLESGTSITKFLMVNDNGMEVEVINLGAILTKIIVPNKENEFENILLSWQDINGYEKNPGNYGAVVGRTAGRIWNGQVTIEDKVYHFYKNNNGSTLHGGQVGFDHKVFEGEAVLTQDSARVKLTYLSEDGEEGYPGNLQVEITYILKNDNSLTIDYKGVTDKTTIVNLTNHAYFNLSGDGKRSILEQEVYLNSDHIFATDNNLVPDGRMISVEDAPAFDFRELKKIGKHIHSEDELIKSCSGYDHVYKLKEGEKAAQLVDKVSGRCMTVTTTEPCIVFYTMNGVDEDWRFANGKEPEPYYGVCFETQKAPIGINEVFKEDVLLKQNQVYTQSTTFKFEVI